MKNFIRGLQNFWKWRKIIWEDRDWDYLYLTKLMHFKMTNMADLLEKNQRHLNTTQTIRKMRIAASLLKRINDDNYEVNAFSSLPEIDMVFTNLDDGMAGGEFVMADTRLPPTKEYKIQNRIASRRAAQVARYDREYFGKLFAKHLTSWWE